MTKQKCFQGKAVALAVALLSGSALASVPALTVSGNQILSGGEATSFAGNSFFWSNTGWGQEKMYNASVVKWLKDDWGSSIVRVAIGADESGSYIDDPEANLERAYKVIDAAIDNDMYVIIDFHTHHGEDKQAAAITFFQTMANRYGDNNNVIYEIYNEPLAVSWSDVIKPYAQNVIDAIRAIDSDNLIVVGTPNWSQDVDVASQDPIEGSNIAYSLHFYAGTHGQYLRNKASTALNNGVALMVTEWGAVNADGDGDVASDSVDAWMDFLKTNNISNANWAVSDKDEGASIINSGASAEGNWSASDLTDSGTYVKSIISNWGTSVDASSDESSDTSSDSSDQASDSDTSTSDDSAASSSSVTCEHVITSTWQGGFQGAIRITNNGDSTVNGWNVNWSYSDGTTISQSWGATLSGAYSATNLSWNATIAPQQTVEVGFIGSGDGSASAVTGDVCN
ncbi:endoglucanase [Vibrio xiamenensis]|uniref:Endoglucanase n=1 Tax=Vibrio xiamenensis TaxID=861298 RepID=D8V609_9VIBR|nr:cellulase family glycosylhydrolase [Vibrio xiamenensis]ADJ93836.1 endo-1,4-beta glucanase cel5A [Vibrio xiamenensis]SDG89476.1 endoglucanase [Vibrio xiamenensis]